MLLSSVTRGPHRSADSLCDRFQGVQHGEEDEE